MSIDVGLEVCVESPPAAIRDARRFGLLSNQASIDRSFRFSHEVLAERFPGRLAALFSPQHGFWGTEQDNMIETPHGSLDGVPLYSLYSETQSPTSEMLAGLDLLVVDLQDVGVRVYTFLKTLQLSITACARAGTPVLVLDRPNPIGGELLEGAPLESDFESLVGIAGFPMRHGLTLGQAARIFGEKTPGSAVSVVPVRGLKPELLWSQLSRPWVATSPNLPRLEGVRTYPGIVLFEGTNISEGRGTTTPFELVGAPFIDSRNLTRKLERRDLPGVRFRPIRFRPTFQKWAGQECGGVYLHVTDERAFRPYRTAIEMLAILRDTYPREFAWRDPPYEYEETLAPIDILSGSERLREAIDGGLIESKLESLVRVDPHDWPLQTGLGAGAGS